MKNPNVGSIWNTKCANSNSVFWAHTPMANRVFLPREKCNAPIVVFGGMFKSQQINPVFQNLHGRWYDIPWHQNSHERCVQSWCVIESSPNFVARRKRIWFPCISLVLILKYWHCRSSQTLDAPRKHKTWDNALSFCKPWDNFVQQSGVGFVRCVVPFSRPINGGKHTRHTFTFRSWKWETHGAIV